MHKCYAHHIEEKYIHVEIDMHWRKNLAAPAFRIPALVLAVILFIAAIVLRVSLYHIETSDYTVFVSQWYDYIQTHNGFAALRYNFSNYNVPYLYLIAILTYLPIPKLIALKSLSVAFDVVLALFTYLLIGLRYPRSFAAVIGALVILFAPTIFINSAAWGQCDAIYTAFCLGSLYFLFKQRPAWACVFFGLAFAFKLQAIFFAPIFFVLLLKKKLPLQHLVLIPTLFLLMLIPAFIAGRDIGSLLSVYEGQITTGGVGTGAIGGGNAWTGGHFNNRGLGPRYDGPGQPPDGGRFHGGRQGSINASSSSSYTYNAPSFYQWLPGNVPEFWKWIGILLAGMFILAIGALTRASKQAFTNKVLLKVVLVFALAIPFCLPEMHERYFYLADVVSVIYAFYFPRYFAIPLVMQLISLASYAPYMLNRQIVDLKYVAVAVLALIIITTTDLVMTLNPNLTNGKGGVMPEHIGSGDPASETAKA